MVNAPTPIPFATLCSGIDMVAKAWEKLGFVSRFVSEIEPFANSVLSYHWPHVPNLGDLTRIDGLAWRGRIDVLWGSFPCQDFSAAGKRKGVSGPRGVLTLAGVRVVDEIDPKVFVFENVKGLLSDPKNAFGQFLAALSGEPDELQPPGRRWADAGAVFGPRRNVAWRVLDAQHFGLPQQRERVFLVACPAASGVDPCSILLEHVAPGRATGQRSDWFQAPLAGTPGCASAYGVAIRGRAGGQQIEERGPIANCLRASQGGSDKPQALVWDGDDWRLRNLTPVEAERCMGIPDDHTLIPTARGFASDTDRYHSIGNSLPVPVVRWIGERIKNALRP